MTIMNPGPIGEHEDSGYYPSVIEHGQESTGDKLVNGINLMADVSLKLGKAVESVQREVMNLSRKFYLTPNRYNPIGSAPATTFNGTANSYFMVLGSPDQGTYWSVNSISATFASWANDDSNTVIANDFFLLVSPTNDPTNVQPQSLVWHEASTYDGTSGQTVIGVPVANTFGSNHIIVTDQEYLIGIIVGASIGSPNTGICSARVTVYNEGQAAADDVVIA